MKRKDDADAKQGYITIMMTMTKTINPNKTGDTVKKTLWEEGEGEGEVDDRDCCPFVSSSSSADERWTV